MTDKKKRKPRPLKVLKGHVVRYEKRFGHVKHVEQGGTGPIVVRFPDPHDSSCYREATFAPNGTILGDGPQVLFRVKTQTEALDEICRDLSCRIEKVDIRLENSKTRISEADESTGESLDW